MDFNTLRNTYKCKNSIALQRIATLCKLVVKRFNPGVDDHKVLLSGGRSNLITDCAIERGNPADAIQFVPAIGRQEQQFGKCPGQVATDAGFASQANAREARDRGVEDLMFACARKKDDPENSHDSKVYKSLRKWRAGIEGIISATKRAFGLNRCTWSGFESFKAYVQLAVFAFNLQTLARHLLA